jgi:hypothetical protein
MRATTADRRLTIAARAGELPLALRLDVPTIIALAFELADLLLASPSPMFFTARIVGQA